MRNDKQRRQAMTVDIYLLSTESPHGDRKIEDLDFYN